MPRKPRVPRTGDLFRFRARMGWNQETAAEKLGVSRATYQRLEAMPRLPRRYERAFSDLKREYGG